MDSLSLLAVSLIPGLLWVAFFYRRDRYEPEPKRLVLKAFVYGAFMVVPAGVIEAPFRQIIAGGSRNLLALLVVSIFVVGLAEEFVKYLAVRVSVYDSHEFNEVMDGIIYSVSAGLGFAAAENLIYASTFGIAVGLTRAIVTCLAHASFSGIVGYYLGRAKFEVERGRQLITRGIVIAMVLHGIYDFVIIGKILPPISALGMVALTYWYLSRRIAAAQAISPFKDNE